uniref:Zinc finger protein-like 1 homolog n=1 Tax=Bracon brevicornis TaxID=1563983 RepID=A0A6V7ILD5_9HYME
MSSEREQKPAVLVGSAGQEIKGAISSSLESSVYQGHSSPSIATSRTSTNANSINSHINTIVHNNGQKQGPPYSVVNIESSNQMERKVFEAYDDPKDISYDHDENKYQRKSAIEWFLRWWKMITRPPTRRRSSPGSLYKRYAIIFILGLLAFAMIIILFSWLGRMATEGDPAYNLMSNPNINVEKKSI